MLLTISFTHYKHLKHILPLNLRINNIIEIINLVVIVLSVWYQNAYIKG